MPTALRSVIRCDDAYLACAATERMKIGQHACPEPCDASLYMARDEREIEFRRAMLEPAKGTIARRVRRHDRRAPRPEPACCSLGLAHADRVRAFEPGASRVAACSAAEALALRARRFEPTRSLSHPQAWTPRPLCCPPGVHCFCRIPSMRSARGLGGGECEARRLWRRRAFFSSSGGIGNWSPARGAGRDWIGWRQTSLDR